MAFHTRSNSFPSRPHPINQEIDEHLCRLKSSETTSTSSSSSIGNKLSGLQDLYDCVDRLLQLPLTQQALAQEHDEKSTNGLLDGSLRLLYICSSAKDALSQTKECVQNLQSIMRRTRAGESGALTSEVRKYLTSRKMVRKEIQKTLKNLKGISRDNETIAVVSKLIDVEAVTFTVFESLLCFISGLKSQASSWSLVSKIMHTKKISCEEAMEGNEFAEVDAALNLLKSSDNAQNELSRLEACIQDQEEGVE